MFADTRDLVKRLGLANVVRLTGFRGDARRLAQCMDLFVLSSFSEGTSMALLEAIAAGVPVAVTDVGGNPEVVIDVRTGWVVPSDDRQMMTAAILDAARDPSKRQALAEAAKLRFEERFTFSGMLDSYRAIYRSLLAINR